MSTQDQPTSDSAEVEPVDSDFAAAVTEGLAELDRGEEVSLDEVKARLGIS